MATLAPALLIIGRGSVILRWRTLRGPGPRLGVLRQGGPCLGAGGLRYIKLLVFENHAAVLGLCLAGESLGFLGPEAIL